MHKKEQLCELEKRIFNYKLKEIRAFRTMSFIVEVNGKTVCLNRNNTMVLVDEPFPTEFTHVELHHVKKVITGAEPKIYSVREWYKNKLQQLSLLMLIIGEEAV